MPLFFSNTEEFIYTPIMGRVTIYALSESGTFHKVVALGGGGVLTSLVFWYFHAKGVHCQM